MKEGKIIIISGPSGVGKSTIIKNLLNDDELDLHYSISMTTRHKRKEEKNGEHYLFKTFNEFNEAIEKGELLEWAEFAGNRYGTPKSYVLDTIKRGHNVLLEIEVNGAINVMSQFKDNVVSIFISPTNFNAVKDRLTNRGTESLDMINERLSIAEKEFAFRDHYQHHVVNDKLDDAIYEIKSIILSEIS